MMRSVMNVSSFLLLCLAVGTGLFVGCEGDDLTGNEFKVNPSAVTMSSTDSAVTLAAVGGKQPFTWAVSDTGLGTVSGTARTVVYSRTGSSGINIVTVTDSQTWTATSTITQTDAAGEVNVSVSPASVTLSHVSDTVAFTAAGGSSPYSWSVGIAGRGTVVAQADSSTAVYTRTGTGDNTVLVTDRGGTVAIANVSQPQDTSLSLNANPASLSRDNDFSVLTVSGGTSPYSWSLSDDALGSLSASAGNSVIYTRNHNGNNVVTVVDAEGYRASIIISQP